MVIYVIQSSFIMKAKIKGIKVDIKTIIQNAIINEIHNASSVSFY